MLLNFSKINEVIYNKGMSDNPLPVISNVLIKVKGVDKDKCNSKSVNQKLIEKIVNNLDYKIIGQIFHEFEPHGVTGVLTLNESHISFHTWPEHRYLVIELLSCKQFEKKEKELTAKCIKKVYKNANISIDIQK